METISKLSPLIGKRISSISLFLVSLAFLFSLPVAAEQTPLPGTYSDITGRGGLTILRKDKVTLFEIESIGDNAHLCFARGIINGNKGYADDNISDPMESLDAVDLSSLTKQVDKTSPQCTVDFVPASIGLIIKANEECRNFCGARAWIEGTYAYLKPECKSDARQSRRQSFSKVYRSKNYAQAYEVINSLYEQCQYFMDWTEIDSVRNDLAVTQYHLGRKEECLSILKENIRAVTSNEKMLKDIYLPSDFEAYLPVAKATWFNLKLCGK